MKNNSVKPFFKNTKVFFNNKKLKDKIVEHNREFSEGSRFLYHVTDKKLRNVILSEGLRGGDLPSIWEHSHLQPRGNYGFEFLDDAITYCFAVGDAFADSWGDPDEFCDIWKINAHSFSPIFDPEAIMSEGELSQREACMNKVCKCSRKSFSCWYIEQEISPKCLSLVNTKDYNQIIAEEASEYFKWCCSRVRMRPLPVWND